MKMFTLFFLSTVTAVSLQAYAVTVPGSFSAHFSHSAVGGGHIYRYSGTVYVNRSRAFIANITRPYRQKACNYNSDVKWIDYPHHTVVRYNVGSLLDMMQILKVAHHYKGNLYKSNYHGYHFLLTLDRKGQLAKLTFTDKEGMRNTIRLSGVHYNKSPFPTSKFRCGIPRGYRVVQGRI